MSERAEFVLFPRLIDTVIDKSTEVELTSNVFFRRKQIAHAPMSEMAPKAASKHRTMTLSPETRKVQRVAFSLNDLDNVSRHGTGIIKFYCFSFMAFRAKRGRV